MRDGKTRFAMALVSAVLLTACSDTTSIHTPARYSGLIPCADCPGIRLTLTLFPPNVAVLKRTYLEAENGQDQTDQSLFNWNQQGQLITLHSLQADSDRYFRVTGAATISLSDAQGRSPQSGLNYTLKRLEQKEITAGPLQISGHFGNRNKEPRWSFCVIYATLPVAMERAFEALKNAYATHSDASEKASLISIDARLAMRVSSDSGDSALSVIPLRFRAAHPHEDCGALGK